MNFGPLNRDGGERRLNVLISRARRRCEVFTNLRADDLDLNRTNARGVAAFKRYLQYAATGELEMDVPTGRGPDSPFEEAVADALRAPGTASCIRSASAASGSTSRSWTPRSPAGTSSASSATGPRTTAPARRATATASGRRSSKGWLADPPDLEHRLVPRPRARAEASRCRDREGQGGARRSRRPTELQMPSLGTGTASLTRARALHTVRQSEARTGATWPSTRCRGERWPRTSRVVRVESPVHIEEVARRIMEANGVSRMGRRIREAVERAASHPAIQATSSGVATSSTPRLKCPQKCPSETVARCRTGRGSSITSRRRRSGGHRRGDQLLLRHCRR